MRRKKKEGGALVCELVELVWLMMHICQRKNKVRISLGFDVGESGAAGDDWLLHPILPGG
jgi:hypothetical protein